MHHKLWLVPFKCRTFKFHHDVVVWYIVTIRMTPAFVDTTHFFLTIFPLMHIALAISTLYSQIPSFQLTHVKIISYWYVSSLWTRPYIIVNKGIADGNVNLGASRLYEMSPSIRRLILYSSDPRITDQAHRNLQNLGATSIMCDNVY